MRSAWLHVSGSFIHSPRTTPLHPLLRDSLSDPHDLVSPRLTQLPFKFPFSLPVGSPLGKPIVVQWYIMVQYQGYLYVECVRLFLCRFYCRQFVNEANAKFHYETTGQEHLDLHFAFDGFPFTELLFRNLN